MEELKSQQRRPGDYFTVPSLSLFSPATFTSDRCLFSGFILVLITSTNHEKNTSWLCFLLDTGLYRAHSKWFC